MKEAEITVCDCSDFIRPTCFIELPLCGLGEPVTLATLRRKCSTGRIPLIPTIFYLFAIVLMERSVLKARMLKE